MTHRQQYAKKSKVMTIDIAGGNDKDPMSKCGKQAENTPKIHKMVRRLPIGIFKTANTSPSSCLVCSLNDSSDWPGDNPYTKGSNNPG